MKRSVQACQDVFLLAGLLLMMMSATSLAATPSTQPSCARPGYVFLECQEPDVDVTSDRVISNEGGLTVDGLQHNCDQAVDPELRLPGSPCIAFSTDGLLVSANSDTETAGPFKSMDKCVSSGSQGASQWQGVQSKVPNCRGTYVFDGTISGMVGVSDVQSALGAVYVRDESYGGGKIGRASCVLC